MDTTNQNAATPSNKHKKQESTQDRTNKRISWLSDGLLFIYPCNDTTLWQYIWASRHISTYNRALAGFQEPDGVFAMLISVGGCVWDALRPGFPHLPCGCGTAEGEELLCQVNTSILLLWASNISWIHFALWQRWISCWKRPQTLGRTVIMKGWTWPKQQSLGTCHSNTWTDPSLFLP